MSLLIARLLVLFQFALPITVTVLQLFQPWTSHRDRLANVMKRAECVKSTRANQRALE